MTEGERIVAAAIQFGLHGLTFSIEAPARHGDIIAALDLAGLPSARMCAPDRQGFLTSNGRFVGRREAADIARLAGQIAKKSGPPEILFSEDVW